MVKDKSSHLVHLKKMCMQKITNLWKFELNRSSKLRDDNERKITLVTRSCVLSDAWFRDLKIYSKSDVWKSNLGKINSFSKTTSLQREPFLTMFYTINLFPLLVTKLGLMIIIILSIATNSVHCLYSGSIGLRVINFEQFLLKEHYRIGFPSK